MFMAATDRDRAQGPMTVDRDRVEFDSRPIVAAITTRGKELAVGDTVAAARLLFALHPVRALPVLDGTRYVGAITEDAIDDTVPANSPVLPFASDTLPTVVSDTPAPEALAVLDRDGGNRLIVLGSDNVSYVGIVCLRGDRRRLCVAAEQLDSAHSS